jgi:hypothetical protein
MDLSGVFSIVVVVLGVLLLLPLVVGAIFVVVVVANRAEPDPTGRRPALVYSLGVGFISLFLTLFSTTAFVSSLCRLIGSQHSNSGLSAVNPLTIATEIGRGGHQHPIGDAVARSAVLSAIVAIIAGLVCAWHLRAAARGSADATRSDQLGRVLSSYIAAVAFTSVIVIVFAGILVIYDIFRGAAPGVFTASGHGDSVNSLRSLIPGLYLTIAAAGILLAHLRFAPPPFRPNVFARWFGGPPSSGAGPAAPSTAPVVVVEEQTEVLASPTSRAPRKRAAARKTTES